MSNTRNLNTFKFTLKRVNTRRRNSINREKLIQNALDERNNLHSSRPDLFSHVADDTILPAQTQTQTQTQTIAAEPTSLIENEKDKERLIKIEYEIKGNTIIFKKNQTLGINERTFNFDHFILLFSLTPDGNTQNTIEKFLDAPESAIKVAYFLDAIKPDQTSREKQITTNYAIATEKFNHQTKISSPYNIPEGAFIRDFFENRNHLHLAVNGITLLEQNIPKIDEENEKLLNNEKLSNNEKDLAAKCLVEETGGIKEFFRAQNPTLDPKILNYILCFANQGGFLNQSKQNLDLSLHPFKFKDSETDYNFIISADGKSVTVIETLTTLHLQNSDFENTAVTGRGYNKEDEEGYGDEEELNHDVITKSNQKPIDELKKFCAITQTVSVISLDAKNNIQHDLVDDKVILLDPVLETIAKRTIGDGLLNDQQEYFENLFKKEKEENESLLGMMLNNEIQIRDEKDYSDVFSELAAERRFYIENKFNPLNYDTQVALLSTKKHSLIDPDNFINEIYKQKNEGCDPNFLARTLNSANVAYHAQFAKTSVETVGKRIMMHDRAAQRESGISQVDKTIGTAFMSFGVGCIAAGAALPFFTLGIGLVVTIPLFVIGGISLIYGAMLYDIGESNVDAKRAESHIKIGDYLQHLIFKPKTQAEIQTEQQKKQFSSTDEVDFLNKTDGEGAEHEVVGSEENSGRSIDEDNDQLDSSTSSCLGEDDTKQGKSKIF